MKYFTSLRQTLGRFNKVNEFKTK